jgi:hypothetical protein
MNERRCHTQSVNTHFFKGTNGTSFSMDIRKVAIPYLCRAGVKRLGGGEKAVMLPCGRNHVEEVW